MSALSNERIHYIRKWLPVWMIVVVTVAASVNRQLIGLIAQPVKLELGLSDIQLGGLASIMGAVTALFSPFLGVVTDRLDRHRIMLCNILIWSMATAAYGLASGYLTVAISLTILALAETAMAPVCNALIADRFKGGDRVNANLIYFAAGGLTTGAGAYLGGLLLHWSAQNLHHIAAVWHGATEWRFAMAVTGVAGLPLAMLTLVLGRDERSAALSSSSDMAQLRGYLEDHWKTLVSFNLSNAGFFVAASATVGWVPVYLIRHFGLTPAELGVRIGTVVGIADLLGIAVGFAVIKRLYSKIGPMAPRYIFQSAIFGIAVLGLMQLRMSTAWSMLIVFGAQNFLATFGTASFNNMVQDMSAPGIRGKIFGINSLFVSVSSIPGPLLVGFMSDKFQDYPNALLYSITIVTVSFIAVSFTIYALTNKIFSETVRSMAYSEY